jgi:hypothetical protein
MSDTSAHALALRHGADEVRRRQLEVQVIERERELDALKVELQKLQDRYLAEIGTLYRELADVESSILEFEVRVGLREAPDPGTSSATEAEADAEAVTDPSCSSNAPPSLELKKIFRDVARTIHPDLAMDEPARYRRHSLMAEANRAYAERDTDRLRLILHAWENDPDAVSDDDPMAGAKRLARLDGQLAAIDAECADLRRSAIYTLKIKIERTRAEGWDLFGEMRLQVSAELGRARARLRKLQATYGIRTLRP